LAQQAVDQRRLAVIDVGDDSNIANVVATHGSCQRRGGCCELRLPDTKLTGRERLEIVAQEAYSGYAALCSLRIFGLVFISRNRQLDNLDEFHFERQSNRSAAQITLRAAVELEALVKTRSSSIMPNLRLRAGRRLRCWELVES
jgi:hypothetical protein